GAVRTFTRLLRWFAQTLRVLELVGAEASFASLAVDERIHEASDVTTRLPYTRMHEDRRVDSLDVVALFDERRPPTLLKISLQFDTKRPVVPHGAKSAVDLRRLKDEAASLAERHEFLEDVRCGRGHRRSNY